MLHKTIPYLLYRLDWTGGARSPNSVRLNPRFSRQMGVLGDVFPMNIVGVGMSDFAFNTRFLHET